jgi:hypothetical protein
VSCWKTPGCGCIEKCEAGLSPVHYIHECPFCHVLHENFDDREEWCRPHRAKRTLSNQRPRNIADWAWDWACPGCEICADLVRPEPPSPAPADVVVLGQN